MKHFVQSVADDISFEFWVSPKSRSGRILGFGNKSSARAADVVWIGLRQRGEQAILRCRFLMARDVSIEVPSDVALPVGKPSCCRDDGRCCEGRILGQNWQL